MEPGGQGGRARKRREGRGGSGANVWDGRSWLHIAPEVDTSEVLVSDPTQTQDDEVLDVDDWFDGSVSALGYLELRGNLYRGVEVGESFRDSFFHGGLRGWVAEQGMRQS